MSAATDLSAVRELPAELTIYTAADTHAVLLSWLDQDKGNNQWTVQAHAVSQIDAAGLQLLLALYRSLDVRGQHLQLRAPSEALCHACRSLGMGVLLNNVVRQEEMA
jgi:anti-anti-sigma regulatory factor